MAEALGIDWGRVKDDAKKLKDAANEVVAAGESVVEVLAILGFELIPSKTMRASDGGWIVNGVSYPGDETTFVDRNTGRGLLNSELPEWFPFPELVLSGLAFADWQKSPTTTNAQAQWLDPTWIASRLVNFAQAGATLEELAELAKVEPGYGLATGNEAEQLRQELAAQPLLTAIACSMDVSAFNAWFREWTLAEEPWQRGIAGPYSVCLPTSLSVGAQEASSPSCSNLRFDDEGAVLTPTDELGRLALPRIGDYERRARALLTTLRTGETMSTGSNFQDFAACVTSAEPSCLAQFPASSDFWARLTEPWREGYDASKKIQLVDNRFGRFLAWNFGKPRGISVTAALAISTPLVLGVAAIAASAWYLKSKTGGR
jgi:hypothetical protein